MTPTESSTTLGPSIVGGVLGVVGAASDAASLGSNLGSNNGWGATMSLLI